MTREAELELEIARLRHAFQTYLDEHEECQDADDWMAMMCSIEAHHVADEDLSTPPSTTALQELIEKVERRTIERCAEYLDETDSQYYDGYEFRTLTPSELGECLRALPTGNLKLEDL